MAIVVEYRDSEVSRLIAVVESTTLKGTWASILLSDLTST